MLSSRRLRAMARKEVLQLRRDPRSLLLAFLLPVLLLVLFGYAISWDVDNIALAVLDQDRSPESRELVESFAAAGYFEVVARLDRAAEISRLVDRNQAQVVLVIPPGFGRRLGGGRQATVQAIVDGSDANSATIILAYSRAVVQSQARAVLLEEGRMEPGALRPPVSARSRIWYNEELLSRNMIVPGLVAVIMMIIAAILTSSTIAREWERGTMEQLAATPVARAEVVLGKLLPYLGIGLADVLISATLGVTVFGVPFRGAPWLLLVLSFFFLVGALGLGMFISAVARSQLLATQMAMLLTFLPAFLLSGFMFAIDLMPAPLRAITYLVPARYFLVVTRGIFLKGVGLEVLRVQGALMVVFAAVGLTLAGRVFKKGLG